MTLKRIPLILAGLAIAAAPLGACGRPGADHQTSPAFGVPQIGGPFQLIDDDGRPVDQSLLKGKWTAVFFGYTFCPDVCPTTLQVLAQAQAQLGAQASKLQVVFITVDPARDGPAQLKSYLAAPVFPKGAIGLTGSPAQIAAVAKAYKVFYQKAGDGPGYAVNHSSAIYLMNPEGRFDRVLEESLAPKEMAAQIADAMH